MEVSSGYRDLLVIGSEARGVAQLTTICEAPGGAINLKLDGQYEIAGPPLAGTSFNKMLLQFHFWYSFEHGHKWNSEFRTFAGCH